VPGPAWTEVRVSTPRGWQELIASALAEEGCPAARFGALSLAEADPGPGRAWVRGYLSEGEDRPERRERLRRALAELAERAGAGELRGLEPLFRVLPHEDFASSWRKDFKPLRVGRLAIVPPDWPGRLRPGDVRLLFEPGGAFGTGRHATTRACLRHLQERLAPGERVLDAGCGSGILAAAALVLGTGTALAFDVDPNALPYARALLDANGLAARCELRLGSFEVLEPSERFQGAMANLDSSLIRSHARHLAASLVGGGWFVCSGCTSAKRGATLAALTSAGLAVERIDVRGRWDLYAGRRTEYAF